MANTSKGRRIKTVSKSDWLAHLKRARSGTGETAARIRAARTSVPLSQAELAAMSGVSISILGKLELARYDGTLDYEDVIARLISACETALSDKVTSIDVARRRRSSSNGAKKAASA